MKKVAILYICTGKYTVFWKKFYLSYEKYFLPETEKHYFVFGDGQSLFDEENNERIHKKRIEHSPWPLPTLLRYWYFSQYSEELSQYDYIFLMNANVICTDYVLEKEYLPNVKYGENLVFTKHPGYEGMEAIYCPYERRKECRAYVSYNRGKQYVFGAMNGGTSSAYLEMVEIINNWAIDDLKRGIIATWHDESYVNKYIVNRNDYKLLSIKYCYPEGWEQQAECKILGLNKAKVLNVAEIKDSEKKETKAGFGKKIKNRYMQYRNKYYPRIRKIIDAIGE